MKVAKDDFDAWERDFGLIQAHIQQMADRARKRHHQSELANWNIIAADPHDEFMKHLQAEVLRNKEDWRLMANTLQVLESGLFTVNTILKQNLTKPKKQSKKK